MTQNSDGAKITREQLDRWLLEQFIVHTREDVPALIDEVKTLRFAVEELTGARQHWQEEAVKEFARAERSNALLRAVLEATDDGEGKYNGTSLDEVRSRIKKHLEDSHVVGK